MAKFPRIFGNVCLILGVYAFSRAGIPYLIDPVPPATMWGFEPKGAGGVTNLRAGYGGLHLATAIILLAAVVSKRLLDGLFVFLVTTLTVISIRIFGIVVDGPDPVTSLILSTELIGLVAAAAGFFVVYRYGRQSTAKE